MSSVKHVRPSRPELEYLVPYDAKDIKAEVMLAANEHPSSLPGEIVEKISGAAARVPVQPLSGSHGDPAARS
jgi:hypothetical protein